MLQMMIDLLQPNNSRNDSPHHYLALQQEALMLTVTTAQPVHTGEKKQKQHLYNFIPGSNRNRRIRLQHCKEHPHQASELRNELLWSLGTKHHLRSHHTDSKSITMASSLGQHSWQALPFPVPQRHSCQRPEGLPLTQ